MKEKFQKFLDAKSITKEQFSKMDAEQIAGLYVEFNEKQTAEIETLVNSKANQSDIEALRKQFTDSLVEQSKTITAAFTEVQKQHGLAIKKLTEAEKQSYVAPQTSIRKALESVKVELAAMKNGKANNRIQVKAAGTMLESTNISGGNVPVEQRIPGLDTVASRRVRLLDIVSRGVAQSNLISWVSQANKDGAAGGTAEGALKNQIDFDLVVSSQALKKRTAFIKVSEEMLEDIDFMNTEINNELVRELLKDVESQVYSGDNTGSNLNGIRTTASAFAAGVFAGTVDNANVVDVLRVAMNQIEVANQEPATHILLHPNDVTKLMLIKVTTTDKRYIDALQIIAGQLMLDGVPIIKTTLVTTDTYLVGHFPFATVWDKGEIMIEVGRENDDFTKNLVTVLAEWRGLNIVKTNRRSAFVKGTISTDAAALETP